MLQKSFVIPPPKILKPEFFANNACRKCISNFLLAKTNRDRNLVVNRFGRPR